MKHVLSIGQCSFDQRNLTRFLQTHFEVEIVAAATANEARQRLRECPYHLVLVNRQFDADGDEGLNFIQQLKSDPETNAIPVMLITNYRDYAERAVTIGAVPGFGKTELGSPTLAARLAPWLSKDTSAVTG